MTLFASLQARLLALVLGMVTLVWLVTAALTWFDVRHELGELLDGHLAQAAALLVVQQIPELDDDDVAQDAPTLHRYAPKVAFQVFHEGRLALRSANAPAQPMMRDNSHFKNGFSTVQIDGTPWRVFATRGSESDVQVFVGEQATSRYSILWAVLRSTLWPMAAALPMLALAIWWAVRSGMLPLRNLRVALVDRRPHDLHPIMIESAPAEMAPMVSALNGLLQRISALMESERRFTADAAHELRTPIAAIRAQAQVALAGSSDPQVSRSLQATLAGCDRAIRLVEQLLTLSRLESDIAPPLRTVDVAVVVRQVVADIASHAIRRGQTISVDAPLSCMTQGDDALLAILVRNLVDNAIRYSPDDATVNVGVGKVGERLQLKVEDSGPAMAEADIQRLGERFFRGIGNEASGSGLGWSIIERIVRAHGADLHVARSATLGGLEVLVTLPR
ncbi:MAG TPA: ATP-binding protein [Steroidobacteraceae bacterium]|nr:ATP-binding protein [Steroidobacteraceae bacterium]HRX88151.1 ATP-binding protein [Steroidobacteraceae bacterium]